FAIEHSPTLDAARRQDLTDELTAKNAFAAFLPSLDFVSNHGVQGSLNAPGFVPVLSSLAATGSGPWVSTVGVSISENLYDNGATITAYRIASAQLEASHLAFMKARENLCLSVASEFYNYSLSTGLLDVRRQRKQILDKQFRLIENSYRQGVKTEQDYLRFKTQVQRAELDLMSAETTLRDSAVELTRLLGGPADGAPPEFAPLAVEATVPAFPEKAPPLSEIFDARIAEAGRKINELNEDLVKRRYWPQVNLAANSGYSFNNYIGSSAAIPPYSAFTYTALLTVTYNLWDFGVRRNNVKIADHNATSVMTT
ncbi:MAG: TolC family protein, partial [Bdellovibrionota bacterium]